MLKLSIKNSGIILLVILLMTGLALPQPVHAYPFEGAVNDAVSGLKTITANYLASLALGIIAFLIAGVGQLIGLVTSGITAMLGWKIFTGDSIIVVWRTFRDLLNMFYIVLLIWISFSTIFNVFKSINTWAAVRKVVISALLINFSLPIGQAVTGFGNFLTHVMTGMYPDIGNSLVQTLQPAMMLASGTSAIDKDSGVALVTTENMSNAESLRYINCLKEGAPTNWDSVKNGVSKTLSFFTGVQFEEEKTRFKTPAECFAEINAARQQSGQPSAPASAAGPSVMLVISAVMNLVVLVIVLSCLVTVVMFLLFRIIAIWLLLAVSPIPFFLLALPKSPGGETDNFSYGKWMKQLIAWNMFAPLYLFCLGLGLMFLRGQGGALSTIIAQGGNPFYNIFQLLIFYFFAAFVFIGGLAFVVKGTFASTIKGTAIAGNLVQKAGVFDSLGLAPARFVSDKTGLSTRYQVTREAVQQDLDRARTRIKGRLPTLMQSKEEALARARARAGVYGGETQVESAVAKRIKAQRELTENRFKAALDRETDPVKRKKMEDDQEDTLRKNLGSGNIDLAVASGEALLAKGKLSPDELKTLGEKYRLLSPLAYTEFAKRRNDQISKQISDKKIDIDKNPDLLGQYMDLMKDDPKKTEEVLKSAFKGKNKVAALKYAADQKIMIDNKVRTMQEALDDEAESFNTEDWLDASSYREATGTSLPPDALKAYQKVLGNKKKAADLQTRAAGRGVDRVVVVTKDILKDQDKVKRAKNILQTKQRDLHTLDAELRKATQQFNKSGARADKKLMEEALFRRDKIKEDIEKLKKMTNA